MYRSLLESDSVASCIAEVEVRVLGELEMVLQRNPTCRHRKQAMISFMQGLNKWIQRTKPEYVAC